MTVLVSLPAPVSAAAVPPEKVDAAIKRGCAYLYSQQKPTGQWENELTRNGVGHIWEGMQGDTFGGYTALCVFALLEAGEKPSDPRLEKALRFLKTADMYGTYSVGIRAMIWAKLSQQPEYKRLLQQDTDRLLGGIIRQGDGLGMWDYDSGRPDVPKDRHGPIDRSVSQFGVLGLWAAAQAGATVPPETWRLFDTVWRNGQNPDGSWSYEGQRGAMDGTVSMTAAGAATLLIVQDVLGTLGGAGGAALPTGNDDHLNRAMVWLANHFDTIPNSGPYTWYGIERISTAGGFRFVGRRDWYAVASQTLVEQQLPNGSFAVGNTPGAQPLTETAFAVLTLAHGQAPVLIGKLNYSAMVEGIPRNAPWHQRPRDAGNLTRYVGNQLEQTFNWQIISFVASPEEMLDAPILLVTGPKEVVFTARERDKLRAYLEGGGLIMATSEAMPKSGGAVGTDEFSKSILTLGKQLYPGRTFRNLPENHPLFTDQQFPGKRWTQKPVVWGLSNGIRELIILVPQGDPGRAWSTNKPAAEPMKWELGANICQYATSRMPRPAKGHTHVVKPIYWTEPATRPVTADGKPATPTTLPTTGPATTAATTPSTGPTTRPSTIKPPAGSRFLNVGRLKVGDNWDPEPGAWERLIGLLANDHKVFADLRMVDADDKQLADIDLLHWTGTTTVKLDAFQRAALTGFVQRGGTILIDAAGGSTAFADSVQTEFSTLFGVSAKEFGALLAPDDPLYRLSEAKIDKVTYRRFMVGRSTGALDVPRLRGLDRAGKTRVYFSREDLTGGCVGQSTDGILGYSPASATAIVRNIAIKCARRQ